MNQNHVNQATPLIKFAYTAGSRNKGFFHVSFSEGAFTKFLNNTDIKVEIVCVDRFKDGSLIFKITPFLDKGYTVAFNDTNENFPWSAQTKNKFIIQFFPDRYKEGPPLERPKYFGKTRAFQIDYDHPKNEPFIAGRSHFYLYIPGSELTPPRRRHLNYIPTPPPPPPPLDPVKTANQHLISLNNYLKNNPNLLLKFEDKNFFKQNGPGEYLISGPLTLMVREVHIKPAFDTPK